MNDKLNKIQQEKRTAQIMVAICAAGLIVSLILTLRHSPLSFLLYGLVFLFYLFVFRKQSKRYQKAVKTAALEECLRPFLKNISYQEKDGLDPKAILNSFCRQQPERRASKPHLLPIQSRLIEIVNSEKCLVQMALP